MIENIKLAFEKLATAVKGFLTGLSKNEAIIFGFVVLFLIVAFAL